MQPEHQRHIVVNIIFLLMVAVCSWEVANSAVLWGAAHTWPKDNFSYSCCSSSPVRSSATNTPVARTTNMSSTERLRRSASCLTDRGATAVPVSSASGFPSTGLKELDLLVLARAFFSLQSRSERGQVQLSRVTCITAHVHKLLQVK